ncbi:MAG: aminoglycoside phosphotransferase family protein [Actinobacteria bacterium]|nr:aminoglycoside phosphotransferase family protein [Actinomycetota bacterium]
MTVSALGCLAHRLITEGLGPTESSSEFAELPIVAVAEGGEFSTWRIGTEAVVKVAPDRATRRPLAREVAALGAVRPHVGIAVPECLYAPNSLSDGIDFAVFSWVNGTPLEQIALSAADPVALQLVEFVERLHSVDISTVDTSVFGLEDRGTPAEALTEAMRWQSTVLKATDLLPPAVEEFMTSADTHPQLPHREPVLSHADLKGEHILLDDDRALSGVIDWADTCLVHPIDDYVGLAISMGLTAVSTQMKGRQDEDLIPAVSHYAKCLTIRHLGRRLDGGDQPPVDLLVRQLQRAFEPLYM